MTVASTPSDAQSEVNSSTFSGGTLSHHPLLGLGDPDLGIGKPFVLQRHPIEPDLGPDLLAHLAHGTGEAAGAAVGHRRVQPSIAGGQEHVEHHLFRDRVADLHRAAGNRFALAIEFGGAERGAVDAVAAGPSADGHDHVAGPRFLERLVAGNQSHVAAKDQRIAQVTRIEVDGPVHRGNAHAVAVVADPGDDALGHAPGMEHAGGDLVQRRVGRGEAEDVGIADRLGAHAGAHRVADHAADARVGPAVRFQGRGVIVRLDLEDHVVLVVEADDAGVVAEDAHAPVVGAQILADLLRGGEDRLPEHVLEASARRMRRDSGSGRRASCGCNARSRSGRRFPVRRRSGRGRASGNGPGWSAFRPARDKAVPGGSRPAGPRRPSCGSARWSGGSCTECPIPGDGSPRGRRSPARWRRWPGPLRCSVPMRSGSRPSIQYFFSVRTTSAFRPKSSIADITLWATGSITPGLGRTWISSCAAPHSQPRRLRRDSG